VTSTTLRRIDGGRILPCADRTVIDPGTVVFDGDRIAWIGRTDQVPAEYAGAASTDATGLTVMPGLVDAHMHISFGEARSEEELSIHTPAAYRAIRASVDAGRVLRAGVTTACDPGGPQGIAVAVRDAVEAGLVEGPRLSAAGRQISSQQGIGDTLPSWIGPLSSSFGVLVRSIDDIVQEIRDEVKDGVDLIKIAGSGPGEEEYGAFAVHELVAAVTEAHRLRHPITIHARSRQAVADAAEAGFDWIMHASHMDGPTLEKVIERDIPLVPAMTLLVNFLEGGDAMSPAALDGMRRELDAAVAILSKAVADGATLIAGSESGFAITPYGEWHTRELELFVDLLGMDDHDALLCMTRNAGRATPRHGADVGTLEPGKFADVLLVDGQPDHDVRILADRSRLRAVIKGGVDVTGDRGRTRERRSFERTRLYASAPHERPEAPSSPSESAP
jgi:imidazolonepropionase-like amidohydrolase